jgi:hypothetical protein
MRQLFRKLVAAYDGIISAMFGDLKKTGWAWARVGLCILFIAAAMSFDFGYQVSFKHGAFLAGLTFVAAFGPDAAHKAFQDKRWASGIAITAGAIICLGLELVSHQSYTAGIRGDNITTAKVQNAKYSGAQEAVSEDKTNLEMWRKRLAALETEHAWAATVTAEALRAQLASANLAIELEAKRGGCKSKCLARTKERDDIATKIALAEEKADLTKKIEATKAVLAKARDKAEAVEYKSSPVVHANQSIADAFAFIRSFGSELAPSESIEKGSQISINFGMALAGTGLPALCLFIAGLYRREEDSHEPQGLTEAQPAPTQTAEQVLEAFLDNVNRHLPKGVPQFAV